MIIRLFKLSLHLAELPTHIKPILLREATQCFINIFRVTQPSLLFNFRIFVFPPKEIPFPLITTQFSATLTKWQPLIYFCIYKSTLWGCLIQVLHNMDSLSLNIMAPKIRPCCRMGQCCIPFYDYIVFPPVGVLVLVYLFIETVVPSPFGLLWVMLL